MLPIIAHHLQATLVFICRAQSVFSDIVFLPCEMFGALNWRRDATPTMPSRVGWLVILASWTTFSSSCCAAALRAPPLTALPRVHPRPARASPLLALSSAEPSFDKPKLDREFITIAAPAFIQFAAEPLARLVDAYYMGRLGAVALGGAGAAIAAQYAVAKLCNDPLLRSTISLVAAGDGAQAGDGTAEATVRAEPVATALLLALFVGLVQVHSMQT